MNAKQNLLETINWGNPEYMPTYLDSEALVGTPVKELFMSPEMYREIIWPYQKRIAQAVRDPRCPAIVDEYQKVKHCLK